MSSERIKEYELVEDFMKRLAEFRGLRKDEAITVNVKFQMPGAVFEITSFYLGNYQGCEQRKIFTYFNEGGVGKVSLINFETGEKVIKDTTLG